MSSYQFSILFNHFQWGMVYKKVNKGNAWYVSTLQKEPKKKDIAYKCIKFEVALCIYPSFEQYHANKKT